VPVWFTAELAKGSSTLVISVKKGQERTDVAAATDAFTTNASSFLIEATDTQKNKAFHEVIVANNRKPLPGAEFPNDFSLGEQPDSVIDPKTKGLLTALAALEDADGIWEEFKCVQFNTCEFALGAYFTDDGDDDSELIFSAAAKHAADGKYLQLSPIDGGIKIVGVEAKLDDPATADGVNESHIIVNVTAEDPNGLKLTRPFTVQMEAQPTAPATLPSVTFDKVTAANAALTKTILRSASSSFKDADDLYPLLMVSSKTSNKDVVAEDGVQKGDNNNEGDLELTIVGNRGNATVTIVLTEPVDGTAGIGQFAETTISVTVTE
jgi:hypothetical protein